MTRNELRAHLEANEARVEQMTQEVGNKIDRLDDRMGHLESNQDGFKADLRSTRSTMLLAFLALAALLVSMLIYAYNRVNTLDERTFQNAQRIEQVAPQSQGQSGNSSQEGSSEQ